MIKHPILHTNHAISIHEMLKRVYSKVINWSMLRHFYSTNLSLGSCISNSSCISWDEKAWWGSHTIETPDTSRKLSIRSAWMPSACFHRSISLARGSTPSNWSLPNSRQISTNLCGKYNDRMWINQILDIFPIGIVSSFSWAHKRISLEIHHRPELRRNHF